MSSPLAQLGRKQPVLGPAQVMPLDREVLVLRKLNLKKIPPGILEMVGLANIAPGVPENRMPWFPEYCANDLSHAPVITKYLVENTRGFAVARTDTGEIIATYGKDELAKADFAVANARTELAVLVDLAEEAEEDEDDDDLEDDENADI